MKDWPVLIQDHHPAYICFEQYLRNQERLRKNSVMTGSSTDESHAGAAREGRALLQGLAVAAIAVAACTLTTAASGVRARFSTAARESERCRPPAPSASSSEASG